MTATRYVTKVRDLIILAGDQYSAIVQGEFETMDAESIIMDADADNDNATPFQIQICSNLRATVSDAFGSLEDQSGNPILAPSAGKVREFIYPAWPSWRIKAGAAVAKESKFRISKSHI